MRDFARLAAFTLAVFTVLWVAETAIMIQKHGIHFNRRHDKCAT